MTYHCYGFEICPDTGKEHWQGYTEFKGQHDWYYIKELLGEKTHIEISGGSSQQNIAYCSEDGQFTEFGKPREQGKRTDLNEVALEIATGANSVDIAMRYPSSYIKYHKGFEKMMELRNRELRRAEREVKVYVYIGPPGCGKTRDAYNYDPRLYKITCMEKSSLWFDGYEGEKTLLIDEMDRECIPYNFMLAICDRYELRLPIKGGHTYANWTTVIITSNKGIDRWWDGKNIDALRRRIDAIKELKAEGPTVATIPEESATVPPTEITDSPNEKTESKRRKRQNSPIFRKIRSGGGNTNPAKGWREIKEKCERLGVKRLDGSE